MKWSKSETNNTIHDTDGVFFSPEIAKLKSFNSIDPQLNITEVKLKSMTLYQNRPG
jgi:hypothetical protein